MEKVVLMYHNIADQPNNIYSISPSVFREHLELIGDYADRVILTFDDGYQGIYENAINFLLRKKIETIVFVVAGQIAGQVDGSPIMDRKELLELRKAGITIGSHGVSHKPIDSLVLLELELTRSKEILEDILSEPIELFSAPNGILPKELSQQYSEELFLNLGYKKVFTSEIGIYDGGFFVPRIVVRKTDTLKTIEKILQFDLSYIKYRKWQSKCISVFKRLIGTNTYEKLKQKLFSVL